MDLGLINKVALVLAASKGLGFACAKLLHQEGADVIICSRSEANLKKAVEEINKDRGNNSIDYEVADLKEEQQIKDLIDAVINKHGKIDILVHNAGGPPSAPIDKITEEDWESSIQLNLKSFITISNLVVPRMVKNGGGNIIAITSVSVKQPLQNLVLSNTTRLAVVGFAKTLVNEYACKNIRVNVVCPGPTLTDRMQEIIDMTVESTGKSEEDVKKAWTDQIPMGRMGTPEEFANLVTFLASDKASYITGTTIQVDGGFVKGPF